MFEEIRREIEQHSAEKKKVAAIHFAALMNADKIHEIHPKKFCDHVGISETYQVEVRKMIGLARYLDEEGYKIVKK